MRFLTTHNHLWDNPTMTLIADKKRRVVLPRPAEPGDAFQCLQAGERFVLVRLKAASPQKPPVAQVPLRPSPFKGINLDAPAFTPMDDESLVLVHTDTLLKGLDGFPQRYFPNIH
jgi:hypothetical protein